jgi:hypothetical protein
MSPAFLHRLLAGGDHGIGGTVYGTVLALAVLAGGASGHADPWKLFGVVAATALVIWVAHVYAHTLGESIERGRRLTLAEFSSVAGHELPIILAAVPPAVVLLLGAIGVMREASAVWVAFGVGLAALAVQGTRYARVERLGRLGTIAVVGLNLALGGIVVALKVAVSH